MDANSPAGDPGARILLVEDDGRLARLVQTFLEGAGYRVRSVGNGAEAIRAIVDDVPDGVILDILLPEVDGIEVCRKVRASYPGWILMLTAQEEEIHEVVGLDSGADDYLAKPVRPQVLLSRIRALLRRAARRAPTVAVSVEGGRGEGASNGRFIVAQDLRVDGTRRTATLAGELLALTDAEFELLWLLASRSPAILTRDEIFSELRGIEHDGLDRSVDMRISKLRRKLGDTEAPHRFLKTVRGRGYLFIVD